ncbi:MAG: DUF4835 family protein, partial [Muribaculaceae bacterium]|nr:DUF4835 family protein [Muribaculaceae bacterium]
MKLKGKIFGIAVALGGFFCCSDAGAQELKCQVEVNSSKIEGTNKSVFESLQTAISE